MQLKALLLDLDGTLVNTAPDMVAALNRLLKNHNQPIANQEQAAKLVSNGANALIRFGYSSQKLSDAELDKLREEFLLDYEQHICEQSHLYDGMSDVLELCEANNIRWGIITNKPLHLSVALLKGLNLFKRCNILLGGDSLPVRKPDPVPLLHSAMQLSLAPSECLYVGDHERDIMAGRGAGMDTAAAQWGYIDDVNETLNWKSSYLISQPSGLYKLVEEKIAAKGKPFQ